MTLKIKKRSFLTHHNHPNSVIANEYEYIRQNIEFSTYENSCRSLLVTSPGKGEGKSTTSANLAVVLATPDKKVLLIDANIKKPSIHHLFKIKNTIGLTNILSGQKTLGDTVNQTDIVSLKVLTSGPLPYNIESLLKSKNMESLYEQALKLYDYIVFDTPSVLEDNTAKILSAKCDGVILVIKSGKTEDNLALEAKRSLQMSKAKILGVIFNNKKRKFSLKRTSKQP